MRLELDHLFICSAPGAPEAELLVQLGLREAPPNQHPGQGTANRRFFFVNAMIELLWVNDAREAGGPGARRTLLGERWSGRQGPASPFGICVRPADSGGTETPFPGWEYRPAYLPAPLAMHIAEAGIDEPMWVYLNFIRRADRERDFAAHPLGIREITGLVLTTPVVLGSAASRRIIESGIMSVRDGAESLLEIEFDGQQRNQRCDLRPRLPLLLRW